MERRGVTLSVINVPESFLEEFRRRLMARDVDLTLKPTFDFSATGALLWARQWPPTKKDLDDFAELIRWLQALPGGFVAHRGGFFAISITGWLSERYLPPDRASKASSELLPLAVAMELSPDAEFLCLVAGSEEWVTWTRDVVESVYRFAEGGVFGRNMLIEGETGTGKTSLAKMVHLYIHQGGPLVQTSGRVLSEGLTESELFGHVAGAFTGADQAKKGKVHKAHKGTLIIDEVDALSLNAQKKLLRFLEDRTFEEVGSNETRKLCCTVIATANVSLHELTRLGKFLPALLARFSQHRLNLQPLRRRPEDCLGLFARELARLAAVNGCSPPRLIKDALPTLLAHPWDGNVREIRSVATAIFLRSGGKDVDGAFVKSLLPKRSERIVEDLLDQAKNLEEFVTECVRRTVSRALFHSRGNFSRAAERLGLVRCTLYKIIERLGFPSLTIRQLVTDSEARLRAIWSRLFIELVDRKKKTKKNKQAGGAKQQ